MGLGPVAHLLVEEHHGEAVFYGVDAAATLAFDGIAHDFDVAHTVGAGEDGFEANFAGWGALLTTRFGDEFFGGAGQEFVAYGGGGAFDGGYG